MCSPGPGSTMKQGAGPQRWKKGGVDVNVAQRGKQCERWVRVPRVGPDSWGSGKRCTKTRWSKRSRMMGRGHRKACGLSRCFVRRSVTRPWGKGVGESGISFGESGSLGPKNRTMLCIDTEGRWTRRLGLRVFGGRQSAWHLVASGGAAAEGGVCQPAAAQGGGKVTQCFPGCPPVRENELPTRRQVPGEATAEKPAEVISGRKHQTARHSVKSRRWVGKQGGWWKGGWPRVQRAKAWRRGCHSLRHWVRFFQQPLHVCRRRRQELT